MTCRAFRRPKPRATAHAGFASVYFAFDLLHLDGRDIASLPPIERKALLELLVAEIPGPQLNDHETGDGELLVR
jgi:bifunctional non-homologous end joining protein LigD